MWLVCALNRSVSVCVDGEYTERVFFSSAYAGAVGVMPVFGDRESAQAYCCEHGDKGFQVVELAVPELEDEEASQGGVKLRVIEGGKA